MDFNVSELLMGSIIRLGGFLADSLPIVIALVLFYLSYRLFSLVISGMMERGDDERKFRRLMILLSPGAVLAIAGIVVLSKPTDMSSIILYLALTLVVGFGFAYLGYKLFDKGVLGASDVEAVWNDKSILVKRAAPGSLFALFGLAVISVSIWQGFAVVKEISSFEAASQKQLLQVVDTKLQRGLDLFAQYLQNKSYQPTK